MIWVFLHGLMACTNHRGDEQASRQASASNDPFPEDSLSEPDTFAPVVQQQLSEQQKQDIYRLVMKGAKTGKDPDVSKLEKQHLQDVYRNFLLAVERYRDSSDQQYSTYFRQLYDDIQAREDILLTTDTLNTRTRLEIARVKSDINTALATRTSHRYNNQP